MIKKILSIVAFFYCFLFPLWVSAQVSATEKKYTAFDMRRNGKIYVLAACMLIILTGLILYLIRLDRKIRKLEKEMK